MGTKIEFEKCLRKKRLRVSTDAKHWIAIELLYIESGEIPQHMIDALEVAKELRENADYESNFSENGARKLVASAEKWLDVTRKLVSK